MLNRILNNKGKVKIGPIIIIILIIVAVLVVLYFMKGFGLGGTGSGSGENSTASSADVSSSVEESTESSEPDTEELTYINVTVSENEYIYQNKKISLDALVEQLIKDATDGVKVQITDENASKRAYDDLVAALDKNEIAYIKAES